MISHRVTSDTSDAGRRAIDLASAMEAFDPPIWVAAPPCGAPGDAPGTAGPWEVGNSLSPPPPWLRTRGQSPAAERRAERRKRRMRRRRGLRRVYRRPEMDALRTALGYLPALAQCGHTCTTGVVGLHLADGAAYLSGLLTCKSVWACPVCSHAILAARSLDVEAVSSWARREHKAVPWLVTLTVRHARADRLRPLLEGLSLAWSKTLAGEAWRRAKERLGFVGSVRRLEITIGPNGWHPHLHLLIWATGDVTAELGWLSERWRTMVARHLGEMHEPDELHAVDVRPLDDAEEYVTKPIHEVTDSDEKKAADGYRAIAQLVDDLDAAEPTAHDLGLWLEYVQATRGRRCLTWSGGLRAAAGLNEGDDDSEGDEEPTGGQVAAIEGERWNQLRDFPEAVSAVLDAAERGDWASVRAAGFELAPEVSTHETRAG